MDDVVIRRMFVVPSFEIHGGVSGLFDLGPPGCGLKGNVVSLWKQHFILTEGMLEMECTNLTPENVLQTSGTWVRTSSCGIHTCACSCAWVGRCGCSTCCPCP